MDIDLVRRLRICADDDKSCKDCGLCETNKDCYNTIVKQAADCIEGMSGDLDRTKDYLEFWQNQAEETKKKLQNSMASIDELNRKLMKSEVDNINLTGWLAEEYAKHLWIPVTERLPEEMDQSCGGWSEAIRPSVDVLVWLSPEERQSVAWYSYTFNEWTTVDENTMYHFEEVTHWMPLPEPPKEETC